MSTTPEFDLQPDPRILPMLGEITLAQWRCVAELVDNAVDGFLSAKRSGASPKEPEVSINLPTTDTASARVTVTDNGPGMAPEVLERAVRAGWSGNSPIESLGMFGMGFNIATARLGTVTTVWTSVAGESEEHGLKIDFEELRKQRHFKTPHLTRAKVDPASHGTTISVENLKPDQRAWLVKPGNRGRVRKELSRSYSAMLRENGVPLNFRLVVNGRQVPATNHCVWDETRSVESPRHGTVFAVQGIDRKLPDRPFCVACWQWLGASDQVCPACGRAEDVVQRKRHVHGWIGLQRFLSSTDYGLDFIRNGRKIEIGNRDLFYWHAPDSEDVELEYSIDDPRQRGRFVGEIHLDHCRVTYTKDRFDRADPAWEEMVGIVRGEGPLQPQKAAGLGYSHNESPLFKLYQAFRRSSPPNARVAGGWANVLVVKDNVRAEEMAKRFEEGEPEYQTDAKWWELVEEEDNKLLTPPGSGGAGGAGGTGGGGLPGFSGGSSGGPAPTPATPMPPPAPVAVTRVAIPSLTREFHHEGTGLRFDVRAFEAAPNDPNLPEGDPWVARRSTEGHWTFIVEPSHRVFRSATLTELDGLLAELAYQVVDFTRDRKPATTFAEAIAYMRERYAGVYQLDAVALSNKADVVLRDIARSWGSGVATDDAVALFNELGTAEREAILHRMASRGVPNPQQVIAEARFLEYATPRLIVGFVTGHPELFFDGRCWEDSYADLDYTYPAATDEARARVLRNYEAVLRDALWLAEQEPEDLAIAVRERVLRASLAVELLAPTAGNGMVEDG